VVFDDEEGGDDDGWKGFSTEDWAVRHGSVGEWLQNVASPQDRKNFKDFLVLLDDFEKSRGIDIRRSVDTKKHGNAIVMKRGPMVSVALKFFNE
jgi:hypothetical protein